MAIENLKPRISIVKLSNWLNTHTKTSECPFCSCNKWEAINGPNYVGCAMPYGDGEGEMYLEGLPILPLVCAECRFVRSIALTKELLEQVLEDESSDSE